MQIVGFIMARDGYAYESPSFAGGYTPSIAPSSTRIFSISRPLSSPFSRHLRRLLEFHAIVVTAPAIRAISRERRGIAIEDIGVRW